MNRAFCLLAFLSISLLLFAACTSEEGDSSGAVEPVSGSQLPSLQDQPDLLADSGASPDAPAVTVNGKVITCAEVDVEVQKIMSQYRAQMPPDQLAKMAPMMKQQALETMINKALLNAAVKQEAIELEEGAVDGKFKEIEGNFPNPEMMDQQLAMAGLTRETLRGDIENGLKIEKLLEKKFADLAAISDEEIADYYKENEARFSRPEEVKASHILLKTAPGDTDEAKEEKKTQLTGIREQLANGADFEELAEKHSDCPSKASGGDLGFFSRGKMVQPFSDAAFGLEVGALSDIVETQFGYHLIKVTDRHDEGLLPLEKAKDEITTTLEQTKRQESFGKYIEELRGEGTIEYGEGFSPPPPPPPPPGE